MEAPPPEAPLRATTVVGNDRHLHGRPYIRPLGLYDHRARFYEPATQTFLEPDPLGPVDSPNLYQAFGYDTFNVTDPWGFKLPQEALWDPETEFYTVDGKRYQVAITQVPFAIGWQETHGAVRDPKTARAVLERAGIDTRVETNTALQKLHKPLYEKTKATGDVVLLYWAAAASPLVTGTSSTAWILGGFGAASGYLSSAVSGANPHSTTLSVVTGFYSSAFLSRLVRIRLTRHGSPLDDLRDVASLASVGAAQSALTEAVREEGLSGIDWNRAATVGLASGFLKPLSLLSPGVSLTAGATFELTVDFMYSATHGSEDTNGVPNTDQQGVMTQ